MVNSCYEVFLDGEHECHNWHDAFGFAKNERGCSLKSPRDSPQCFFVDGRVCELVGSTGFHSYGETSHRGKKMKELRDYPIV
jgi:hypothetical protein